MTRAPAIQTVVTVAMMMEAPNPPEQEQVAANRTDTSTATHHMLRATAVKAKEPIRGSENLAPMPMRDSLNLDLRTQERRRSVERVRLL